MPKLPDGWGGAAEPEPSGWARPAAATPRLAPGELTRLRETIRAKIQRPEDVPVTVDDGEVVTFTEIDNWRQCPLKHHWGYVQRWGREAQEGSPLHRGSAWHRLMEAYYGVLADYPARTRGKRVAEIKEEIDRRVWPQLHDDQGRQTEQQQLLNWMYDGYWQRYGVETDWEILAVEDSGRLRLRDEDDQPTRFWYQFKIDLLVYALDLRRIWLVDHKSASTFTRKVEIDVDDQFGGYTWALREMGVDVFGAIRSDARTQRNVGPMSLDQRYLRTPTRRTPIELLNIQRDLLANARMAWDRDPRDLPASSVSPNLCSWRCDFLHVHLQARQGTNPESALRSLGFSQRPAGGKHPEYGGGGGDG